MICKMAAVDVFAKEFFVYYVLPVIAFLILILLFSKKLKQMRLKLIAFVSSKVLIKVHRKLEREKVLLLSRLKQQSRPNNLGRMTILEIGCGSGLNFDFYPHGASILCLDPNPHNKKYVEENLLATKSNLKMEFIVGFGESMPFIEDETCDAVLCSLVLCTVKDISAVLKEAKRVLKPNGVFYFIEHVAAKNGSFKRKLQDAVNPAYRLCSDGCNMNRETWMDIKHAGFSETQISHFNISFLKFTIQAIYGTCVK